VTAKNNHLNDWEYDTPKDIRAGAVKDVVTAYKAAFTNLKRGNISKFKLNWRIKKNEKSIVIPKSAINLTNGKLNIYKNYHLGPMKISKDRSISTLEIKQDCRLGKCYNHWYLYVPIKITTKTHVPKYDTCALDPGVRKFQTVYSENKVVKVPMRKELLKKLQEKMDTLQSLKDKKIIKLNRWKRGRARIQIKLTNIIDDMHYKLINYLKHNFKTVFIPSFESQGMVMKNKNRKCNRNMLQLKHYLFRTRLTEAYSLVPDTKVKVCTEEYTSKTCGSCGHINNQLGASEFFECPNCGLKIDRDINGARNIYMKTMLELH